MERIYKNEFTGLVRKYVGGVGYNLNDGLWVVTKTPEELVKKLPYYKLQKSE